MAADNRGLGISLTVIAFFIFGTLGSSEIRCQRHYYAEGTYQQAEIGDYHQLSRFDRAGLPCIVERALADPQAAQASEKDRRDLIAQEAMALWAFWMVVFAGFTALVTSVGTFLIWRQVSLTRQAVQETGDATEAMREANKIAREVGEAQVRAYLEIVTPYVEITARGYPKVGFFVRNYGASPARDFAADLTLQIYPQDCDSTTLPTVSTKPKNVTASSEEIEIQSVAFRDEVPPELKDRLLNDDAHISMVLVIKARWDDVFKKREEVSTHYSTVWKDWVVGQRYGFMLMSDFATVARNEISDDGYQESREAFD